MPIVKIRGINRDGVLFQVNRETRFQSFAEKPFFLNILLKDIFHFSYNRYRIGWNRAGVSFWTDDIGVSRKGTWHGNWTKCRDELKPKVPKDEVARVTKKELVLEDGRVIPLDRYKNYTLGQLFRYSDRDVDWFYKSIDSSVPKISIQEITKEGIEFQYVDRHVFHPFEEYPFYLNIYLKDIFHFGYTEDYIEWSDPDAGYEMKFFTGCRMDSVCGNWTRYCRHLVNKTPDDVIVKITDGSVTLDDGRGIGLDKYRDYTLGQLFGYSKNAVNWTWSSRRGAE